jgi:hypothetical protein
MTVVSRKAPAAELPGLLTRIQTLSPLRIGIETTASNAAFVGTHSGGSFSTSS